MNALLIVSLLVRLSAFAWAVYLLARLREWRMGFLALMLLFLALRVLLVLLEAEPGWETEVPAVGTSILAAAAVVFVGRALGHGRHQQEVLAASEARYRALVCATAQTVWGTDAHGVSAESARWWQELTGMPIEAQQGLGWTDAVHPDDRDRVRTVWSRCLVEQSPFTMEFRARRADGTHRHLAVRGVPMRAADGRFLEWVGTITDITDLKNDEKERARLFAEEQAGRLRLEALSRRLVEVEEAERRRVARELHDQVGQSLTALKLALQLCPPSPAVTDCVAVADETLHLVRNLSVDLRPAVLDDLGLAPALRWYLDRQAQRLGVTAHFQADLPPGRLPASVETVCFRVAQEALTNVGRHANARNVWLDVSAVDGEVRLRVADDGVGFDPADARRRAAGGGSLGVVSMQERVELAGGRFALDAAPGRGAQVLVRLPLAPPEAP